MISKSDQSVLFVLISGQVINLMVA